MKFNKGQKAIADKKAANYVKLLKTLKPEKKEVTAYEKAIAKSIDAAKKDATKAKQKGIDAIEIKFPGFKKFHRNFNRGK